MYPVAVDPAALPSAALPLLDLARAVGVSPGSEHLPGPLGAAIDRFERAWRREAADIADEAREQVDAVVRAAALYERLEATLALGSLR